jgi:hypothetical protein
MVRESSWITCESARPGNGGSFSGSRIRRENGNRQKQAHHV